MSCPDLQVTMSITKPLPCLFFPAHLHLSFPMCALTFWPVSISGWKCQGRRNDSFARNQDSTSNTAYIYIHWTRNLLPELLQHSLCGILTSKFSVYSIAREIFLKHKLYQAWHSRYSTHHFLSCNGPVKHMVILLKQRYLFSMSEWCLILDF